MASWRTTGGVGGGQENNGPRAKCDQVVFEAIAKAAEIVVGSRCWIDGNFAAGTNNSSRFNLLVPEVQGVRSILQRWKRALHVPLRLDVYYQHKDSRRELLERWCLEYAPKLNSGGGPKPFFDDPIVQLRQVCKQIVVWLRTLYCWSRMLPAQALRQRHNNPIGFSIYVVSEGNDDVSGLVENQGFQSQAQPHSVTTPYGELGWKVFYAPKNPMIQRLLPEKSPYASATPISGGRTSATRSQPIPMHQQPHHHSPSSSSNKQHLLQRRESSSPTPMAHHSAPTSNQRMYRRANSATPGMMSDGSSHNNNSNNPMGLATSMRANSGLPSFVRQEQQQQQTQQPSDQQQHVPLSSSADSKPPTKSMSGLSLAMMQSDENIDDNNNDNKDTSKEESTAEKRRAALHHAPPQFGSPIASSPVLKKSLASAGEYGYGYNNHILIPTNRTPSGNFVAADDPIQQSPRSSTPTTPLASTPPGYLYGGPTPPAMVPSNLIPPRNAVTPPFVRPMGFVGEPPSQPLPPPAGIAAAGTINSNHPALIPNLKGSHHASLDLLHSSPFQQVPHQSALLFRGIDASSVLPPTSATMQSFSDLNHHHSIQSHNHPFLDETDNPDHPPAPFAQEDDDDDDMPFAVDAPSSSSTTFALEPNATNSYIVAKKKKLALFESVTANNNNSVASLSDQLAEFKSFGASLNLGTAASQTTAAS